ncbi:lipase [Actinokineospora auranticolor]|uniref:Platelet-activating factor acetylhydrolase isoform II n=1 Tax=Actinokineospora auranticolor TaxID=155976 RepID=A0A2S6GJM1_9PSEU|nr:lipase [Actinokineospora auranticolor]PPK65417.1 platelet-activating factor acetylhydrolase isoform II [Actinokineospora auranticolor]
MSTKHIRATGVVAGLAVLSALATATPAAAAPAGRAPGVEVGLGDLRVDATKAAKPGANPVRVRVPEPTGRSRVGTTDLHLVDQDRVDPWKPDRKRELMVTISYPSGGGGQRANWVTPGLAAVIDQAAGPELFGVQPGAVDWTGVRRAAKADTRADGRWPVVLFSPGFGSPRELGAAMVDDLASHGYVVVSLSHTFESFAVEFPGGRTELGVVPDYEPATMQTAIDARVADTRFVLDELARLTRGQNPDVDGKSLPRGLAGALDLSRVGMYGHSYGGYTAGEAMFHDRRIDAGINLDGSMGTEERPSQVAAHGLDRPFLLVGADFANPDGTWDEHSHRPQGFDVSWAKFWANQRGWTRDLHLNHATHYGVTDLQFVVPQLAKAMPPGKVQELVGTIDPARSWAAQTDYYSAFFDLHLKGRDRHLFGNKPPRHPDVTFLQ